MIVGFTGTQIGLTPDQLGSLVYQMNEIRLIFGITEVHHGGCIGADEMFDSYCATMGIKRIVHRGTTREKWAGCEGSIELAPIPNLERNRLVVRMSDILLAAPKELDEVRRSGTWATVRYARKEGVPIIYLWPTGAITREG